MSRNWPASKSSDVTLKSVQEGDHSRNPSSFSDSIYFVCSTYQKCVFNENHDACITKFPKEVNSRVKDQSLKTRNSNKPVEQKSHTQTPIQQIFTRHRVSPHKSSVVFKKTSPRSCLRWKPMGRIFKTVGLRWVPTGKIFTSSTTKVDSEHPNGSNADITNPYECEQNLNVCAGTLNLSTEQWRLQTTLQAPLFKEKRGVLFNALYLEKEEKSSSFRPFASTIFIFSHVRLVIKWINYFNPPPSVASLVPRVVALDLADSTGTPSSTTIDQDAPS
ncbi:hypothetical protein Tco_1563679 [Tanacetum coccineum]